MMLGRRKAATAVTDAPGDGPARSTNGLARSTAPKGALQRFDPQHAELVADVDEVFRGIYTRSGMVNREVLGVCSAIGGEGRTTVGLGLAVSLAQDYPDRQVLLVETDMQRAALARDFEMEATPGLLDCLTNDEPIHIGYRGTFLDNLQLLPIGGPVTNPSRLLRSDGMAEALDQMRQTHDVVILDLPPLLLNSDAVLLSDLVDGLVLVVRAGATPAHLVTRVLEEIDPAKLRGVILNGVQSAVPTWLRRVCGL